MSFYKHALMMAASLIAIGAELPPSMTYLRASPSGFDGSWGYRRSHLHQHGGAVAHRKWKRRRASGHQ
jgi:hypothetical protein